MKIKMPKTLPYITTTFLKSVLYTECLSASSVFCYEFKTPDNLDNLKKELSQKAK